MRLACFIISVITMSSNVIWSFTKKEMVTFGKEMEPNTIDVAFPVIHKQALFKGLGKWPISMQLFPKNREKIFGLFLGLVHRHCNWDLCIYMCVCMCIYGCMYICVIYICIFIQMHHFVPKYMLYCIIWCPSAVGGQFLMSTKGKCLMITIYFLHSYFKLGGTY